MKGGYQASSRLATTLDEIGMEAKAAADSPSADVWRKAFVEIARLTCEAKRFAAYMTCGPQAPLGGMAGA